MIREENIDNSDFHWNRLLSRIKRRNVIPVIGQGLYRVDIDAERKHYVLLYDYLAKQLLEMCGADINPDETHKFAKACFEFLKNNHNDYVELSKFLKMTLNKVRLIPGNPLWKLARIKSFNFFITTVYDDLMTNIVNSIKNIPTQSFSYTLLEKNIYLLNNELFNSLQNSQCTVVFHIFGNFQVVIQPAYTENDLQQTMLEFNKDRAEDFRNLLFEKLLNSSFLFIGHGYDDWLYRLLIQTIASKSLQYVKSQQDSFIIDNFENKKDPFKELPKFLKNYGAEVFYSEDGGGTFVDTLFKRLEEKFPDEIIPVSDFPETVFISFEGHDRPAARKLASKLQKDGINVWFDQSNFKPGDRVGEIIIKALDKCPVFMPLISKNSKKILSSNGKLKYHVLEWERANSNMKSGNNPKQIIPVKIDDTNWIYDKFEAIYHIKIPNGDPHSAYGDYEKLIYLLRKWQEEARYGPVTVDADEDEKRDRQKFFYDKAKKLIDKEKYDEALSFIQKAEEEKLVDENTFYLKSKALEKKGEEDKASQLRMELINANILSADFYNDETIFLIKRQRYWDAISIIEKAVKRNCADDDTRALKKTVFKSLSDHEETLFRQNKDKRFIYPEAVSILGRDGEIESAAETLDKIPIFTVYGIPGTGKSTLIYEIWKSKSHNNKLYKRYIIKPGMTINDLFEQLAPILGCRHLLNKADFELSDKSEFSFLKKEAQYYVDSLIHLDNAHFLFNENRFGVPGIKKFLTAITKFYPGTKIIIESRIVPPEGIFPEKLHQSHRLHGINKDGMILYFCQPFKDNPKIGWVLEGNEQDLVLKNLEGIKKKEKIHPLAMILVARMAHQLNKTPVEILTDTTILKRLIHESGNLLLAGLNKNILQSMGRNMVLNIEMYREDIPVYLYEKLDTHIEGLLRDTKFEDSSSTAEFGLASADYWENELRTAVTKKLFPNGKKYLQEIIKLDSDRKERLKREFGFLYDFENPEEDENNWKQKEAQIEWRRKVWQVLSERNSFILECVEEKNLEETKTDDPPGRKDSKTSENNYIREGKQSVQIGSELETPVLELFEKFLILCRQEFKIDILKKRKQPSGFQFGYDLEFSCQIEGDKELKLRIECKNYVNEIKLDHIAGKLATTKLNFTNDPIDHWILISPFAIVSSDLNQCLKSWDTNDYPFKIQVWNKEAGVDQFFGLVPEIYDKFFEPQEGQIHPKNWSEKKRQEVFESWKRKLEPPLRLPKGWEEYLRNPKKLILEPKEINVFEKQYDNNYYVEMNCKDETGATLPQTLEEKVMEWFEETVSKSPTLFLLGEFGDGKTFFTYVITRKLVEKFLKSPKDGWIPVRFALKNFESENIKSPQEFLQHRLNDFGANIAGWNELRYSGYKILAILDGFDEISKELDPETIQKNIDILINCYESDYFSDMKLLITSRKHFFESHKEKDWLIDKLDNPQLLHLAPIDRKTTEDYLRTYAVEIGEVEKFNKLKECHDPIGLASKPLFLEMVQVSLKKLPGENLNEYTLYETYIKETLERKIKFLYDKKKETPKARIIENLLNVLQLVAQKLQQSNLEFIYLSDIKVEADVKEWLWDISAPDKKTTEDEKARAAARSLLKRVATKKQSKNKKWPMDFCHRSMREYFVARAVCNMIENNLEETGKFLTDTFLSHEILFFTCEIMKHHKNFNYESSLLNLIGKTRGIEKMDRIKLGFLGTNAVNLLYRYKGKLPEYDWRKLVLDGAILPYADLSGKDFSGTSLQYANLDNVNFTDSNFSYCNLTEVRIEETAPVQSIAIPPNEKILALYHDGVIREWSYKKLQGPISTNLTFNEMEKDIRIIVQPGNDLTILHDRYLFYYDRAGNELKPKATIEINSSLKLIKATHDFLLLNKRYDKQTQLLLVDLNKQATVKSIICSPSFLCEHFDNQALVIFNENEELQLIDVSSKRREDLLIPTGEKVACITACKCKELDGEYLLGLGLYDGTVQIWKIQVQQWKYHKLLELILHEQKQPIKDICFIDEYHIVSGGLDKTIKMLNFNQDGQPIGEPKELKMTLQCRGMKIEGVIREKEKKKLQELIEKTI